jgi:hypothetical protein
MLTSFFFVIIIIIISPDEAEKSITPLESTLTTIHLCQTCGMEYEENSTICFQCQENESIDREIKNNNTLLSQQVCLLCHSINNAMTFSFLLVNLNK